MYACDYLENGFLNTLRGITFAAPAHCYLALYLNDPGESGTAGSEVSYSGYKRMPIDFSAPADTHGGIGIQNLVDITFPTPTTAAGTITHIGITDSATGGNMLVRSELIEPLVIGAQEPPVFLAGDILIYLSGALSNTWKTRLLNVMRGQTIATVSPYLALWNGSPDGGGSELGGGNYSRVPVTFGAPEEQANGQVILKNSATVSFARPSTTWGHWTHTAVYSAASAGEPIYIHQLIESKDLKKGYMPIFAAKTIELGLN